MAFGDFTVVRSTVKNVLNSSGLLASVAINTPAFEFNADGSYKGLLVEPAGTNLFTYSQQYDNVAWSKVASTVTANATTAPDGTLTADKLVEDSTTAIHRAEQLKTLTATAHSLSFYLKQGERTFGGIRGVNSLAQNCQAWFNLATGTVGTVQGTGATATIEPAPNGFYRCTLTIASANASGFEYRVFIATNDAVTSYLGDGASGIFVWQAQLETGSVATSPITTEAFTVTRTADVITLTGASSLIGQTEGTIFVEVEPRINADLRRMLILSDGTTNNRIDMVLHSSTRPRLIVTTGGVSQVNMQPAGSISGVTKIAACYKLDDFAIYSGGVSLDTDISGTVPACNRIDLGNSTAGLNQINGWIRSVALFPTRLSNAQLESLTTL